MFLDADELAADAVLEADVCIVGAGAAGLTLALALQAARRDVLLLESGGRGPEPATQALYAGHVADPRLHSPLDRYRQRQFGGSTTLWGGRCVPFDDIDFAPREFVPVSGWPIAAAAVRRWYDEASRLCEAGPFAYTEAEAFPEPLPPLIRGFTGQHFSTDHLERFSCPTDFGRRYEARLRAGGRVRICLHANVTRLTASADGLRVEALEVATLAGRRFRVRAREVVLAAGGLEIPRLLLASPAPAGHAIGNAHDVVGRYYMSHLAGTIGTLRVAGPAANVSHGYDLSADGIYCRRRFALRPEVQRRERVGNFVARLHHPRITNPGHGNAALSLLYLAAPIIPWEYRRRLVEEPGAAPGRLFGHLANLVTGAPAAAAFGWHMLRDRILAERRFPSIIIRPRDNLFSIDFHAEQEPNPASRVTLAADRDALGMPRLQVDWRYTPGDVRTVARALDLLAADVAAGGVGRFAFDPDSVEQEMTRYGAYGGHHIGTARMGVDPRTSVVDGDGRVHGISNLHIAGSAVFPTSGQANPTLTIVALALRLAATLVERARVPELAPELSR